MEDKYCLECGESVSMKAKKCDYCGSKELDVMEIEAEEL
jgi:ribosomal protein L40E